MPDPGPAGAPTSLPWGAWERQRTIELDVPGQWIVERLAMADAPALTADALRSALDQPLDAPAFGELLRGRARLAIAVDDATRPTRTAPIVQELVRRALDAGLRPDRIAVIIASGAHRAPGPEDVERKTGEALPPGVRVLGHDPVEAVVDTGVALAGVPVRLHREFLAADVRVGVGAVIPHPFAGFSGGGKVVIPGLADLDVLARTHKFALMGLRGGAGLEGNRFRTEMESAVRAIGLHWTVNVVINSQCETAAVFAGDLVSAHRAAAGRASQVGATAPPSAPLDALILNAYPKDAEVLQVEAAFVALRSGMLAWLRPGAPVVLTAACDDGLGTHGLFGPGGRLHRTPSRRSSLGATPLWLWLPGADEQAVRAAFSSDYPSFTSWSGVSDAIAAAAPSPPRVGLVPCGPLQVVTGGTATEGEGGPA